MLRILLIALLFAAATPTYAAWWNPDWAYRKKITLDTTDSGAAIKDSLAQVPVAVRLHTGNVTFADLAPDGADIRFVAADDKTPLKHHVESFDVSNELAIAWVQVPKLPGNSKSEYIWMYYGNKKAAKADDLKGTYDGSQTLVLHFSDAEGSPKDASPQANAIRESTLKLGTPGVLGAGAALGGGSRVLLAATPALKIAPASGFTFSAWLKLSEPQRGAVLYAQQDGARSLVISVDGTRLQAKITGAATAETRSGDLGTTAWRHVAVVAGDGRLAVYVDGVEAGAVKAAIPELGGDVSIGAAANGSGGVRGTLDEVRLSNVARSAGWIRLGYAGEGQDAKLAAFGEDEQSGGGAGHSYFGVLLDNLTVDAWVVIAILMVMMAVSFAVMLLKTRFVFAIERANRVFVERFESSGAGLRDDPHAHAGAMPGGIAVDRAIERSPLLHLYNLGTQEVHHRLELYRSRGMAESLTPQAVNSIRARLDAGIVREGARLNSQMVLLTIAISGGPFLGLLGTVVGVMITFAAIAAQGDVNVNAIAPGIAAALMATVAGLGVAIPCLFGYNWLASRIRNISNDMHIFADELLAKLAEAHSA